MIVSNHILVLGILLLVALLPTTLSTERHFYHRGGNKSVAAGSPCRIVEKCHAPNRGFRRSDDGRRRRKLNRGNGVRSSSSRSLRSTAVPTRSPTRSTTSSSNTTTSDPRTMTSRFGCITGSPLVKQETGCPCFSLETLTTALVDLNATDYRCFYSESEPVDLNDPCIHLLHPDSHMNFEVGLPFKEKESLDMHFRIRKQNYQVDDGDDDDEQADGECSADIHYSISSTTIGDHDDEEKDGSSSEGHHFNIWFPLTRDQVHDCETVFLQLKELLPETCSIEMTDW